MANLFEGIYNIIAGIIQSIFAVFQSIFNIIYSVIHGLFVFVFDILESIAQFVGASVNFVISNLLILGILAVVFIIYNDRSKRNNVSVGSKKKAA